MTHVWTLPVARMKRSVIRESRPLNQPRISLRFIRATSEPQGSGCLTIESGDGARNAREARVYARHSASLFRKRDSDQSPGVRTISYLRRWASFFISALPPSMSP
jgi:hypothetical protein